MLYIIHYNYILIIIITNEMIYEMNHMLNSGYEIK